MSYELHVCVKVDENVLGSYHIHTSAHNINQTYPKSFDLWFYEFHSGCNTLLLMKRVVHAFHPTLKTFSNTLELLSLPLKVGEVT